MILKKVGCEQFAGITEKEFELDEHMNVIVGDNESGKTTMLDMIYHVLNTGVDLKRNEKKEFFDTYMPADKISGFSGDCVDGKVTFETESGTFTVTKEWSQDEDCSCRLKSADGSVMKAKKNVEEKLREELIFGQAMYHNLIFSTQNDKDQILRGILDATENSGVKEAKGELASRVNQTVMELDGISIEELEEELHKKIKEYESNWDSERNRPKAKSPGKGGDRWKKDIGKILESYYAMEDKERELEQAESAEENFERARQELEKAKVSVAEATEELREYRKYTQDISSRSKTEQLVKNVRRDLEIYQKDAEKWPSLAEKQEKLIRLKEEFDQAEAMNTAKVRYEKLMSLEGCLAKLQAELKENGDISVEDYNEVKACERFLEKMQTALKGMSGLKGKIKVQDGTKVEIYQGMDRRPVQIKDGEFEPEEAFEIHVPDVMDFMIYPKDVDMEGVLFEVNRYTEKRKKILNAYRKKHTESFVENYEVCNQLRIEIQAQEAVLSTFLQDNAKEEILAEYEECQVEGRELEAIRQDICEICKPEDMAETIGSFRAELKALQEKYNSQENLAKEIESLEENLKKLQEELSAIREIPKKYLNLQDTKVAEAEFQQCLEEAEDLRREKESIFLQYEKELPEKTYEDIEPEYERTREEFEKNIETYGHWKHILSVFESTKAKMTKNPSLDIQENTKRYLEELTSGNVTIQAEEGLDIGVVSRGNIMNYRLLSEGTKETVALAFRLAVLENLYGEKKGFAVFDDSMIDMDPTRREAATRLLKKFSEKYQVIYVTCDPKFGEMLGGNVIKIG